VAIGDARPWLAEEILVEGRAKKLTRDLAEEALRRLLGGKSMAQVFPAAGAKEDAPPEDDASGSEPKDKAPAFERWHNLLPALQKVTVQRTEETIGVIGKVDGLVAKVFQLTEKDPVHSELITVAGVGESLGHFVVLRLKSRTTPDPKEFANNKEQIVQDLTEVKRDDAVKRWVYARCEALRAEGHIKLAAHITDVEVYTGEGEKRKRQIFKYVPCQRLERFGRPAATY
jgi:hypothetical protein